MECGREERGGGGCGGVLVVCEESVCVCVWGGGILV